MDNEVDKCERCGGDEICSPHTCPFMVDVDKDHVTLCNCCEKCQDACSDDI